MCLLFRALLSLGVQRAEVASARTFIYLAPTTELMECQKRAFFVKIVGPHPLSRVEVTLKDNKSGQTIVQSFPEIDPGPLRSDQYLMVYAIVAVGRRLHPHGHFKRIALVTELDPRYSASDSVRYTGHSRGRSTSGSKLSRQATPSLMHARCEGNALLC